MWSIGYAACPSEGGAQQGWLDAADEQDGVWLTSFQTLAREVGMAIAVTCLERTDDGPQNAVFLFDRWGRLALPYAKVHTSSFDWEAVLVPGDALPVADLETAAGPVRVGAMICFDREFPSPPARSPARQIVVPNACEMELNRMSQLRARAFENVCAIGLANYPAPFANGSSVVFDGVPLTADGVSRDMAVAVAGDEPAIVVAEVDLAALREARAREPWGATRFRRPAAYL
ncbi:MAG: carbon-nitrogen hydrolase family protein [Tepidiformaceae bacterium]